jgi:Ca-activated chloride channel family protein
MIQPLSILNKMQLTQAINSFQPMGYTPIAGALKKAKEIVEENDPEKTTNIIYLISDGIETCDGDPVAVAKELNSLNVQTMVNIVGFGVNDSAQAQLQATALAGGGEYYSVNSAEEMEKVFGDRSEYLKKEKEYRDCIQSSSSKNRDEIQSVAIKVRDCLQGKALKEKEGIREEILLMKNNKSINWGCWQKIDNKTKDNFAETYNNARDNAAEIYNNARDNAAEIYKKSLKDWNEIYKENK